MLDRANHALYVSVAFASARAPTARLSMPEVPFHLTRNGVRFYESTMPELVRQLTRLNDLLERLVAAQEKETEQEVRE